MFKFRLQRVLELRARKERDAATALATAQGQVDAARAEEARLAEARDALASTQGASVGELRTLQFLLGRLDERAANAATMTSNAETIAAQKQDDLRAAFRDRRTLDRLRERHEESWRQAEVVADRQQMDEIALTRFAQPTTTQTSTDES